jgi:hypothetical protein
VGFSSCKLMKSVGWHEVSDYNSSVRHFLNTSCLINLERGIGNIIFEFHARS